MTVGCDCSFQLGDPVWIREPEGSERPGEYIGENERPGLRRPARGAGRRAGGSVWGVVGQANRLIDEFGFAAVAAAVVPLREHPHALRVRLDGPPDRRARQAMRSQNLEPEAAERARAQFDRAHEAYFRQFYGIQIKDPALSHVVLDSTSIELDACVEMIVRAAESLAPATAAAAVSGPA